LHRKSWPFMVSFLAPAVLLYLVFIIYPFLSSIRYSLFNWDGVGPIENFIGLKNYSFVLWSKSFSGQFWNAVLHNFYFFALTMILVSVLGLGISYLLTKIKETNSRVFQAIYFLPMVVPPIVIAYLWAMYLEPNSGAVSDILSVLHLNFMNVPFLGTPSTALPTIAVITVWATLGYNIFIFIPALNNIPAEITEAAQVDGASGSRTFFSVIFPMILPTYLTITTLVFIGAFGVFDYIYILEGVEGGPNYATDTLSILFFRTAFGSSVGGSAGGLGLAAAMAVIGFVIVMIASAGLVILQKRASQNL